MPKNKFIYYGILIVVATVLLWAGYQITNVALKILPWTGGIGALIIMIGLLIEMRRGKNPDVGNGERPSPRGQTEP